MAPSHARKTIQCLSNEVEVEALDYARVERGIEGAIVLAPPPLDATVGDVDVSDFPSSNLDIDRINPKWKTMCTRACTNVLGPTSLGRA